MSMALEQHQSQPSACAVMWCLVWVGVGAQSSEKLLWHLELIDLPHTEFVSGSPSFSQALESLFALQLLLEQQRSEPAALLAALKQFCL